MDASRTHVVEQPVHGPWSLATSVSFWEGFAPSALPTQHDQELEVTFRCDADWHLVNARISQHGANQYGSTARIALSGTGDLDSAAAQAVRFLSLDIDAREWPEVGRRDRVIGEAQGLLPGLRPCGFFSPWEAAAWSVLSQRIRIVQASHLRQQITDDLGERGAFPSPRTLRHADLDLPGRKAEYLHAVADAALEGRLNADELRSLAPEDALARIEEIKGLGPFAADLVLIRGANAPDVLPRQERRLDAEIADKYGAGHTLTDVAEAWRPFRSWASVYLRALREERTHEIAGAPHSES